MKRSYAISLRAVGRLALGSFVLVAGVQVAAADTATLVADASTSSSQPHNNYGAFATLPVNGPPATIASGKVYLRFDLSTLPPGISGAAVGKATLTVFVGDVSTAGSFDVFRVTSAWTESDITADNAPTLAGTPEASGVVIATADENDFKTIDVTQLVMDWLDNLQPNDGLALVPNAAGISVAFDSKENTATSHAARLDIALAAVQSFSGNLSGDVTGTQNATHVAKINGATLGSLAGATSGQALTFNGADWRPGSVVNSLTAGSGLSLSGSTGNVTASVPPGGVTNSMLASSSVTVAAGTGLSGGGAVALGGSTTLNNAGVLSVGASAPLTSSGGQTPNVSLTGTVPVANGGTEASTASGARSNLGAAARGANADITSLSGITGNIALPHSTSASAGNVLKGGVPFLHNFGSNNTFLGLNAGNFALAGSNNSALGIYTLYSNTTGSYNTALGTSALFSNTAGNYNIALGAAALILNTTGEDNTAVGNWALVTNDTGNYNIGLGTSALYSNTAGSANTALGIAALSGNSFGNYNTALGTNALASNSTGDFNIALGFGAGYDTTGSNNIDIGHWGEAGESDTIRIGIPGTQTATYIAGISGATSSAGVAVYVNSAGKLGTTPSSARFKTDIQDMGDSSRGLMTLRPVRFRYKKDIDPSGLEQYGLVAEEVAKVYPALVVYDDKGHPQAVRYHFVNAMLLNEVQRQARQIETLKQETVRQTQRLDEQGRQIAQLTDQNGQLAEQVRQIEALTARVRHLETVQQNGTAMEVTHKAAAGL